MIYLFVLYDSLTSYRFTTRTEKLTKCYDPLQKLRVRLGTCKTGLRFLITIIIVFSAHKYFIDFFKKMWHVTYQNNP